MSEPPFDIVLIGGGSAGLTGARLAARLGVRVALVEKHKIGGDCTWSGCVPSKALLKAAKMAHEARRSAAFGVEVGPVRVDLSKVREHVRGVVARVASSETAEVLEASGIRVFLGAASFCSPDSLRVGDAVLSAKRFVIATGAFPSIPVIPGLDQVPFDTYETIFDNEQLPARLLVFGAGPIGVELAQAYRRFGAEVTVIADEILPREEPETRELLRRVWESEGIHFVSGKVHRVRMDPGEIVLEYSEGELRAERLLVALGRRPNVEGLGLEHAGVHHQRNGIPVDDCLRTSAPHIYAAGDVLGGLQFTHLAGWQCFQAVRNALLPGNAKGMPQLVPGVTFTDPEIARVGPTEAMLRKHHGTRLRVHFRSLEHEDRALCERETHGFIKVLTSPTGILLGATIVAPRAGEMISELALAVQRRVSLADLATVSHAYPTWSMACHQLASEVVLSDFLAGSAGQWAARLGRWMR